MAVILLNPGPVVLSERVRATLGRPLICHREREFEALQRDARARLLQVYALPETEWSAALITGSGTVAVEAMLTSLVPREGRVLILENGVYGERMTRIADLHGLRFECVRVDWGAEIPLDRVAAILSSGEGFTHVAVVHHETTTGCLNPLGRLSELCRAQGVDVLVDVVSSFGAEWIDGDQRSIAAYAGTSGKCLHGAPGIGFVLARRSALLSTCRPPRTLCLDVGGYVAEQEADGTPFTPSIPVLFALAEALAELEEKGGWRIRHARYELLQGRVRAALDALGVEPYLAPSRSSVVLSSYRLPTGMTYAELHARLRARSFVIYAGQGGLRNALFRLSTMGEISDADLDRFIAALDEILRDSSWRERPLRPRATA